MTHYNIHCTPEKIRSTSFFQNIVLVIRLSSGFLNLPERQWLPTFSESLNNDDVTSISNNKYEHKIHLFIFSNVDCEAISSDRSENWKFATFLSINAYL